MLIFKKEKVSNSNNDSYLSVYGHTNSSQSVSFISTNMPGRLQKSKEIKKRKVNENMKYSTFRSYKPGTLKKQITGWFIETFSKFVLQGEHSREIWVEVCNWGFQTLSKTSVLPSWPWFTLFRTQYFFKSNFLEKDIVVPLTKTAQWQPSNSF